MQNQGRAEGQKLNKDIDEIIIDYDSGSVVYALNGNDDKRMSEF